MNDPAVAVTDLRDASDVECREVTIEISAETWPDDPTDGRVNVGAIVLSPTLSRVALVRNWWSGDRWVFPGGGVEPRDASLRAAVRREVREETGLAVAVEEPLLIEASTWVRADDNGDSGDASPSFDGWFVLYRAVSGGTTFGDDPGENADEIEAVRWFDGAPESLLDHGDLVRECLDHS
ncbi:NUDIX hydrolase (plasmid) [Haloferacaceae archaeon DSL9]